jgi:DNA-binding transcriptional MerR regulator
MNKYNQNTIKVSIVDENGEEVPVMQYLPFKDGSDREVLTGDWENNLMASAPIQMKELWILHQTGYKGTPMHVILSAPGTRVQYGLLMNWYRLKGITRPCIRTQNKFTKEELETINECRKRGVPYKQIAEKMNGRHTARSIEAVWVKMNPRNERPVKRQESRKYSREELDEIKRLRIEGLTYRAIAERMNRKPGSAQAACKGYTKHCLRSMKQKLNEVALRVYGHRFSTLLNWKNGESRQRIVRDMVEGKTPLLPSSGIIEVLQKCSPTRVLENVILFSVNRIPEQHKLCFYHIFNSHSYHRIY